VCAEKSQSRINKELLRLNDGVHLAGATPPSHSPFELDKLLTPAEAAERLRVTEGTLSVWRCEGRYNLKFVRIGSRIFYRSAAIQRFIEERETTETSHPARRSRKAVRP